jgi:putative ABC transport system ATP-binding protein
MSLRVTDVSLSFGDGGERVQALAGVSLNVDAGELVAVVGPSGSGKSSLLAVCGGLRSPTSGDITVGEELITGLNAAELTRIRQQKIGFVFQQSNLLPSLNALDQLLLIAHIAGNRSAGQSRERALELLEQVGMSHRLNRRPGELSGGERQRIGIARSLMSRPALLLVDEPTSMLDHDRGRQIVELLARECHEHRVATLMVTHDAAMLDVADRVARMQDGRLTEPGRNAAH